VRLHAEPSLPAVRGLSEHGLGVMTRAENHRDERPQQTPAELPAKLTDEIGSLRESLSSLQDEVAGLKDAMVQERSENERLRAALSHAFELLLLRLDEGGRGGTQAARQGEHRSQPLPAAARRSRSEIAAAVAAFLRDPELARLPDPEIAMRLGVARQTVTNWRRRLHGQAGRARHRTKTSAPES